jgi:hypothetical protein
MYKSMKEGNKKKKKEKKGIERKRAHVGWN